MNWKRERRIHGIWVGRRAILSQGCRTDGMGWQLVGEIAITIVDDLQSTKVNVALSFYQESLCIL